MTTHPPRACGRRLRSSADSLVNNQWLFVCSAARRQPGLQPAGSGRCSHHCQQQQQQQLTRLQQTESSASVIASQVHRVGRRLATCSHGRTSSCRNVKFLYSTVINILIFHHWKWPAQGTGTVLTVSAHLFLSTMQTSVSFVIATDFMSLRTTNMQILSPPALVSLVVIVRDACIRFFNSEVL